MDIKWIFIGIRVLIILAVFYLFKVNGQHNLFKDSTKLKIKDYLLTIFICSTVAIVGSYPQLKLGFTIIEFDKLAPIAAGIFGGPIVGGSVGAIVGSYSFLFQSYELLILFNSLILGIIAGLFRINIKISNKCNYNQLFIRQLLPLGLVYFLLTVGMMNGIDNFLLINELSRFFLNLLLIFVILVLVNKVCKKRINKRVKMMEQNNLDQHLHELNILCNLTQEAVDSNVNLYHTLESVVDMTCEFLEVEAGGILIIDPKRNEFSYKVVKNIDDKLLEDELTKDKVHYFKNLIKQESPQAFNHLQSDNKFDFVRESGYQHLAVVSLNSDCGSNNLVYGLLFVASNIEFSQQELDILVTISKQATSLIRSNQLFERMQKNVAELSTLQMISKTINSTLDLDQVLELAIDVIVGTMGVSACAVLLTDEDNQELTLEASRGLPANFTDQQTFGFQDSIFSKIIDDGETVIYNHVPEQLKDDLNFQEMKSVIVVPLKLRDEIIGLIPAVNTMMSHTFDEDDERFLSTLSNQVAVAIENARIYNQMEEMAIRDGLTGLYNHSYFQRTLSSELERVKRYNQQLSLLLLDIDNFKKVNDNYGHPVGDQVLKQLADKLKKITRQMDIVARYGGEEFAIILPETGTKGAKKLAKRINQAIREMVVEEEGVKISITVSIGLTTYQDHLSQKELISRVDEALYQAKEEGKDRICIS
ncbi:MAG: diguanylate cyclase [Bacillota bacterium]